MRIKLVRNLTNSNIIPIIYPLRLPCNNKCTVITHYIQQTYIQLNPISQIPSKFPKSPFDTPLPTLKSPFVIATQTIHDQRRATRFKKIKKERKNIK